jgi:hypothetical protein
MRETVNRLKFLSLPGVIIVVVVLVTLFVRAGGAKAALAATCTWKVIPSQNAGTTSTLIKVAAISTSDVWAVGSGSDSTGNSLTLTEHWNGSTWNVVASPNVGSSGNSLTGVTAISASNIWAVGSYVNSSTNVGQTLIEHWNGSTWRVVPSPNTSANFNALSDIKAVSTNDIWAIGHTGPPVAFVTHNPLIEHWNGSTWRVVSNPASQLNGDLRGVSIVSANNIWAVGGYLPSGGNNFQTLTEHWNGTKWSIVPGSDITGNNDYFEDVSAISASNIWAVGGSQANNYQSSMTLIEHWNGTQWSIVTSPNPDPTNNSLRAVTHVPGKTSVWTVGDTGNGSPSQTLTEFHC